MVEGRCHLLRDHFLFPCKKNLVTKIWVDGAYLVDGAETFQAPPEKFSFKNMSCYSSTAVEGVVWVEHDENGTSVFRTAEVIGKSSDNRTLVKLSDGREVRAKTSALREIRTQKQRSDIEELRQEYENGGSLQRFVFGVHNELNEGEGDPH